MSKLKIIFAGIGTFGKVVLSQDTETGDYYALKVLALHDIIKMKQMEHIRNERDMLQAVRGHPFIVNLYVMHHLLKLIEPLLFKSIDLGTLEIFQ
jgi:protein kinase X